MSAPEEKVKEDLAAGQEAGPSLSSVQQQERLALLADLDKIDAKLKLADAKIAYGLPTTVAAGLFTGGLGIALTGPATGVAAQTREQ